MIATPSLDAKGRSQNLLLNPQIFHRTFECGHPDEFIEIRLTDDGERLHNLISFENFQKHTWAETHLTYAVARYLTCAKRAKNDDDNDQSVQPKRTLSAYQSGTSITHQRQTSDLPRPRDAFERTLERYKLASGQANGRKLHPRVSEQEHRAHRLEVLKEAVESSGKWLALPAKRVTGVPIRRAGEADISAWQKGRSPEHDYRSVQQAETQTVEVNPNREEPVHCQDDFVSLGISHGLERNGAKLAGDEVARYTKTYYAEKLGAFSIESNWNVEEEQSYRNAQNVSSLSGSRLKRQQRLSEGIECVVGSRDTLIMESTTETSEVREKPAVTEHSIGQFFNKASSSGGSRYESPRSAPAAPRKGRLSFRRRRSSTITGVSIQSEPGSRNYRKLSIDILQSARSLRRRDSIDDSPDWACQTSLAIEAGKLSMDDVGVQSRRSTTSRYSAEGMPSFMKVAPSESGRRQEIGSGIKHEDPALPSVGYSPVPSTLGRHSEGALQAMRREEGARQIEKLSGLEDTHLRELSKRFWDKVVPSVNLNKKLPALPLSGSWQSGDL